MPRLAEIGVNPTFLKDKIRSQKKGKLRAKQQPWLY